MSEAALPGARPTARVISVMNQKGGVGKTTTTLNLGAALALQGKRVLLVDLDPQANLTHGVNRRAADLSQCIYELLISQKPDARALVQHTDYERLDLLPSHIDVSGAEIELVPMIGRETRLKRSVDILRQEYDYILIDCLPALSLLTVNALVASDEALVPLQAHPFALEGLGKLFEVVGMIREALNADLRVTGVLVTLFDGRTNVSRETLERLKKDERLAPHLFETIVKVNIKIAESQNFGIPVVHYEPRSPGALAYVALCEELLEMENGCLASEARGRIRARRAKESEAEEAVPADEDGANASAPGGPATEAAVTIIAAEGVAPLQAAPPEPPPPSAPPTEERASKPSSALVSSAESKPSEPPAPAEPKPPTPPSVAAAVPNSAEEKCATTGLPSSAPAPEAPKTAEPPTAQAEPAPAAPKEAPVAVNAKAESEPARQPATLAAPQSAAAVPSAEAAGPQATTEEKAESEPAPLRQRLPDVTDPSFRPRLNLVPHPGPLPVPAAAPKTADESRPESGDSGT